MLFVQDLLDEGEPLLMRFEHSWLIVADTCAFSVACIAGVERLACCRVLQSAIDLLLGAPSRDIGRGELSLLHRRSIEEVVGSLVFEHLRRFARALEPLYIGAAPLNARRKRNKFMCCFILLDHSLQG